MHKTILCLHAASANIALVEQAAQHNSHIRCKHIVDTQLMEMIREHTPLHEQKDYVTRVLEILLAEQPDILLITCTNYIALLDHVPLYTTIPILKIDELFFQQISDSDKPIKLLFTNKNTVEGTMTRLHQYINKPLTIEVLFIPELFEWYIAGDKLRHDQALINTLQSFNSYEYQIAVAQLSMSDGAEQYNQLNQAHIYHPLSALQAYFQTLIG